MEERDVPSGITPWPWGARMEVHRLVLCEVQLLHWRHSGLQSGLTWSPVFNEATPAPTPTTTPAPSCPKITGNSPSGSAPERVNSSVWQTPGALISNSHSANFRPSGTDR